MRATWAGRLLMALGVVCASVPARGEEPAAKTPAESRLAPEAAGAEAPVDAGKVRAETTERLKRLDAPQKVEGQEKAKAPGAGAKALREILEERLRWLDNWDGAAPLRREAEHPEQRPEQLSALYKTAQERVKTQLGQLDRDPLAQLPAEFQRAGTTLTEAMRSDMKEAIEAAKNDLKEWKTKAETLRSGASEAPAEERWKAKLEKLRSQTAASSKSSNLLTLLRAERDKIHQRVAALPPRRAERAAAVAAAKTADERAIADERLINFEWESRVENERLAAFEAKIALEAQRADLVGPHQQLLDSHVVLAGKILERMQERYQKLTERQESDLHKAAASEESRAAKEGDPLQRYRARRKAQLLELEAVVLKNENELASSPSPSLEEQKGLADRADSDFASIKHLLDDGRLSHLDALRFNNDFRRIGPQRAWIAGRELAAADRQLTRYENALSAVEFDLINDRRDDLFEQENVLEQLPKSRHDEARAVFKEVDQTYERDHEKLLNRNRAALEKLASRAEETHAQIVRRLRTLDDQYGFIRTHIFWVRDENPIGLTTLAQAERGFLLTAKALVKLAMEGCDRALWGRVSGEFIAASVFLVLLPWPLRRLAISLRRIARGEMAGWQHTLAGSFAVGVASSALAPAYLGLLAYAARQGPWPRSLAHPAAWSLAMMVPGTFAIRLVRWMLRRGGWAETRLSLPRKVARQLSEAVLTLTLVAVPLALLEGLLAQGQIAPGGRPVSAPAFGRILHLGVELIVWGVVFSLTRGHSALVRWLLQFPDRLGWLNRRRREFCWSILAALGGVVALDAVGYRFTAERLTIGVGQGILVAAFCWGTYRLLLRAIDHHAWRWVRPAQASGSGEVPDASATPDDLANRLRQVAAYLVPVLGLFLTARTWGVDWALFRTVGEMKLWPTDPDTSVTVGEFATFVVILAVTAAVWRHISTFFAIAVFPRMRDDPGVRFAVVTLCRYAVLAVGLLIGLSTIHLGLQKIGMVLAALGVGLGFGLQEIVSNFVCGIILLLERPIRVGDLVTVSGMSGKVDRINIRATTITNGDNQSIIVPNRAFITSDLVNWTLKDKVIRVSIRLKVAPGTDPDRASDLLLAIAREDADVLRNPLPASFMEDFSDATLNLVLHVHVPDPSLGSRVRHRLFSQIQKRFAEAGIVIPLPAQQLHVHSLVTPASGTEMTAVDHYRLDGASETPPAPRFATQATVPEAVEDCHRGVDE